MHFAAWVIVSQPGRARWAPHVCWGAKRERPRTRTNVGGCEILPPKTKIQKFSHLGLAYIFRFG